MLQPVFHAPILLLVCACVHADLTHLASQAVTTRDDCFAVGENAPLV